MFISENLLPVFPPSCSIPYFSLRTITSQHTLDGSKQKTNKCVPSITFISVYNITDFNHHHHNHYIKDY